MTACGPPQRVRRAARVVIRLLLARRTDRRLGPQRPLILICRMWKETGSIIPIGMTTAAEASLASTASVWLSLMSIGPTSSLVTLPCTLISPTRDTYVENLRKPDTCNLFIFLFLYVDCAYDPDDYCYC